MNKGYGNILPEALYIVGYNDECLHLYNSSIYPDTRIIAREGTDIPQSIEVVFSSVPEKVITTEILKRSLAVIVNTKSEKENIRICTKIKDYIASVIANTAENEGAGLTRELFSSFKLFVIGNGSFSKIYEKIEDESFGCIRYLNPALIGAFDFIDKYPIAKFIPRDKILTDTTIDNKFDINVIMIGFGELNREILISSVANNQFLTRLDSGELVPKTLRYTVLGEGLDNSIKAAIPLFRYERELVGYNERGEIIQNPDYLELPPPPASVDFVDINFDTDTVLRKIYELSSDEKSLSLIIIDYSSFEENALLASTILNSGLLKNREKNIKVFARLNKEVKRIYSFGNTSVFLDTPAIIEDKIYRMAMERNRIYTLESEYLKDIADGSFDGTFEDIIALADYKWCTVRSTAERKSNIYAVLSMRSKLNLLGLDYTNEDINELDTQIYDELYSRGEIKYLEGITVMGRRIPAEMTYEFRDSVRGILAHQEHYRWNSFMISEGYIPAAIQQIVNEKNASSKYTNGKNNELKRHGNITTENGLIKYRQLISERDECDELMRDVICYDYQLMDDAIWLIYKNGYKLIIKEEEND